MAKLEDITISTCEYRPCWWTGQKALFHKWGTSNGDTIGIIELEDGQVREVAPSSIEFDNHKVFEYGYFKREQR